MNTRSIQKISNSDSLVIKKIKEKLNVSNGVATIPLFKGDLFDIAFDYNGKGIITSKIPTPDQLTWEVFEAAVEVVLQNGGKAKKGNAQSGAKIGSDKLPINSVEGYVAHKVHGVPIGRSAFGPAFVICAILDWAGICNNVRGYLIIKQSYLDEMR